jgi:hypothetical protein
VSTQAPTRLIQCIVRENCVYTLDDERKFLGLFGNDETSPAQIETQLDVIARQVPKKKKTYFALLILY